MSAFDVEVTESGKIIDFLDGTVLEPTPEEFIRQSYLRTLHFEYQYPKEVLAREVPIYYGHTEMSDAQGNPIRADIVVYRSSKARSNRDQGAIAFVIECKAPTIETGHNQLVSYIYNTSAEGGVWYNGDAPRYFRRLFAPTNDLVSWTGVPRPGEAWDSLGRRKKSDLLQPKDIKGLLRRCHNKLHGRGVDGDEEDLTMDMVRIILSKAMDEENASALCKFYCTPEEYNSEEGQQAVADRVAQLFSEVVRDNSDVFDVHERISVGKRAICDVVVELQAYRLLSDLHDSSDWDIMGHAYEQYTATYLKRKRGQFFTNRLVVDFMVAAIDPGYKDIILDPAGGSGGFLTGSMRHVRKKILGSAGTTISKQRQLDKHRTNLFMVEISKRLVKIAKTAMILNGDGHTGMTQGDSLGPVDALNERVVARAGLGKPSVILTNPPFAGVGEGRITDPRILDSFTTGLKWHFRGGDYIQTNERVQEGVPPEMLFFERCLNWIAPGGKIGIVMPKSFLDTQTYYSARRMLLDNFRLLGVVNCHKNTFQPHTGVRTCLLLVERPAEEETIPTDYPIFMGISRKIGQDSEGIPIFKRDPANNVTNEIDHDLNDILDDYRSFRAGSLKPSEYRFSVLKSTVDSRLRINPQVHLPNLNATIREIEAMDGVDGWAVTTLGQADTGIQIFKGPRLKSENLIVEERGPNVESYYTPSAVLQEKGDSAKLLDVSRATKNQLLTIAAIRVRRGDIVVSRSGTIGRVAYITRSLDGAIVSDDLIRVRIDNPMLRLYALQFLESQWAQDQMQRNEYGAVQQHLEPQHVQDMLIPIPDDWSRVSSIIKAAKRRVRVKELLAAATTHAEEKMSKLKVQLRKTNEEEDL